jgi:hypothetical protein
MKDWSERQPSIMFECDDVERTYEELKNRGVEVGSLPANNLQQSWRFDWEPPKAVLRDVWTIDWILGC